SVQLVMIYSILLPLLFSSIVGSPILYSPSYDIFRNGNINLRNGEGGEYSQLLANSRGRGEYELRQGDTIGGYAQGSNNYGSNVPSFSSSSSYGGPSYFDSHYSRPIALVINNYPPSQMEEVKTVNGIDSHYSRPIKYRPPPNRIVHSENWYDRLVVKPRPTTLPPPIFIPPSYIPPPYQPDMSKYRWTAILASKGYQGESSSSNYPVPPKPYSTDYVSS
ncbi:hypothetical protein PRIPAC_76712, partial [Pristionchus pacificus]